MRTTILIVCGLAISLQALPASAAGLSKNDIVCALDPKCAEPPTRSFKRGITASGGNTEGAPLAVDLYVSFAYDSADLTGDARITLDQLGGALRDPRLSGFTFMVAGHTDAKGGVDYNQKLSERRAEAVRQYLVAQFAIDQLRLRALGFGKARLFDASRPEDGVNRRVQVLNMTASAAARGPK
jgi:outer membrane protein OmpA-like peptidoglycan-associated protein